MKKLLLSLFLATVVIFVLSGCKNNEKQNTSMQETSNTMQQLGSNQQDNKQGVNAYEISNNPNQQVDISKSGAAKNSKETAVKNKILLTYSVEKPVSSNISLPSSMLNIVFSSDSAYTAFKDDVSENIEKYIQIEPKIKGAWKLKNNKSLLFIPQQEWTADTKYTVTIDKTVFNDYYEISSNTFSFTTDPFMFQIS